MDHDAQIMALIYTLGRSKNKPPSAEVADTYVELLGGYPLELLAHAIAALIADPGAWFPTVGQIVAAMLACLRGLPADSGTPPILPNDAAWRLALLTIRSYQPQTRPRPTSNNPAVDAAIRRLGGVAELGSTLVHADEDRKGKAILRRDFLVAYEEEVGKPEHLRWVLTTGGARPYAVPGLEVPDAELARLEAEARQQGRALPPALDAVAQRLPERAALLDGRPPASVYPALPAPSTPLTPEQRQALRAAMLTQARAMEDRMRLPEGGPVAEIAQGLDALRATEGRRHFTPQEVAEAEAHLARLRQQKEAAHGA